MYRMPASTTFLLCIYLLTLAPIGTSGQECKCGGAEFSPDLMNGEFKSPGYPNNYCANLDCNYVISARPNTSVHLSFTHFSVEKTHDYLEIYQTYMDGGNHYENKIEVITGYMSVKPVYASATGSGFRLRFVTDRSEHFGGFHARFSRANVTSDAGYKQPPRYHEMGCPKFYYEAVSQENPLESPPTTFPFTSGCWFMVNSSGYLAPRITFRSVAENARILVYESENFGHVRRMDVPALEVTSASTFPISVVSRTHSLLIRSLLSAKTIKKAKNLFEAVYNQVESPCKCFPDNYEANDEKEVSVLSPGYPAEYCHKLDCKSIISLKAHRTYDGKESAIQLKINDLSLEDMSDYLHLFSLKDRSSHHLLSLTGAIGELRFRYFTFNTREAEIEFISDATEADRGFNISLSSVGRNSDCKCKGEKQPVEYATLKGTLTIEAPSNCSYLDCFVSISLGAQSGSDDVKRRLIINTSYKFKGGDEEFIEFIAPVTENIIPSGTNNERAVALYDSRVELEGTKKYVSSYQVMAWYHLASQLTMDTSSQLNITYEWIPICVCGETELRANIDEWKSLASPDYPENYCNDLKCQYHLSSPEGTRVVINITEINTEPNEDILTIFNGRSTSSGKIDGFSGMEWIDYLIKSTGNEMTICFQTDSSVTAKGYHLFYSAQYIEIPRGSSHVLLVICCCLLLITLGFATFVSYQKGLFCFGNLQNRWNPSSIVGFSNIAENDEQSSAPLHNRPSFR